MYNVAVIVNMQVAIFEIKSHFVYNVAVIVNMQVAIFEIKSHFVYNVAVICQYAGGIYSRTISTSVSMRQNT